MEHDALVDSFTLHIQTEIQRRVEADTRANTAETRLREQTEVANIRHRQIEQLEDLVLVETERALAAEERVVAANERAFAAEERVVAADERAFAAEEIAVAAEERVVAAEERVVAADERAQERCTICLEKLFDHTRLIRVLECNHAFHNRCISSFLNETEGNCPLCRSHVPAFRTYYMDYSEVVQTGKCSHGNKTMLP